MDFEDLLKKRNITQAGICIELKERFNCNRAQTIVSRWFSGKVLPSIQIVVYLSKILNVSCDEIINLILDKRKWDFTFLLKKTTKAK